jgi:two-component system, chemotaxis family, protein-glutamate methylesterase/glutaminase
MIRVLIVDDSSFIRKTIRQMLSFDSEIEIIEEASDGRDAIEKTIALKPDVITMDIIMPGVDGVWALEEIMKQKPTPVIIVSSIGLSSSDITQEALSLGVIDIVVKPDSPQNIPVIARELVEKVKAAARVGKLRLLEQKALAPIKKTLSSNVKAHQIVIIVTSAGGPPSLYEVISKFSEKFYAGVVVAQHIPTNFLGSFVGHIQKMTTMNANIAKKGDLLYSRRILFSPTDTTLQLHQTKKGAVVDLVDFKVRLQPDIDSVIIACASIFKSGTILVVLSGLGNDGVKGAEEVKRLGGKVIVEDKSTAGIYTGMPLSVIKSGFYDATCPSYSIAETVEGFLNKRTDNFSLNKFIVKGLILKSIIGYLRTNCTPKVFDTFINSLSRETRDALNNTLNAYNYYPVELYYELYIKIEKHCTAQSKDILAILGTQTAQECFVLYKQGFPVNDVNHFITFLPTFQKAVFPGSTWEVSVNAPELKRVEYIHRNEGLNEQVARIQSKVLGAWIACIFQTTGTNVAENKTEIGEDSNGWYIKFQLKWK